MNVVILVCTSARRPLTRVPQAVYGDNSDTTVAGDARWEIDSGGEGVQSCTTMPVLQCVYISGQHALVVLWFVFLLKHTACYGGIRYLPIAHISHTPRVVRVYPALQVHDELPVVECEF